MYEAVAILLHRIQNARAHMTVAQVQRIKAIYDALKSHHWMLTGPEDLPACVLLSSSQAPPAEIGARVEAFYQGLIGANHGAVEHFGQELVHGKGDDRLRDRTHDVEPEAEPEARKTL